MSNKIKFGTHCVMMTFQITCAALNIFILSLFYRFNGLSKNKQLRLILYLTISDVLFPLFELPFSIYLAINWNWDVLNFDPRFILVSSIPLPSQLKISAILTISIALSRNMALIYPGIYLRLKHENYANTALITSICFAVIDVFLYFSMSDFEPKPGCASSGCFVGDNFRYYWGISNMTLGCVIFLLSITIFLKVNKQKNQVLRRSSKEVNFRQANRTSLGILCSSLAFLTVPSVFVGIFEMRGFSIFKHVGPFYATSLLSNGKTYLQNIVNKPTREVDQVRSVDNPYLSRISGLRGNKSLRLILYLTISDFLFALGELPYSIYILSNSNMDLLNYNPQHILILSTPLPAQLKISAILTISIALSRNVALTYPVFYLKLDQVKFANSTAIVAICFAVLDVILVFIFSDFEAKPGCGSAGCFYGNGFRFYWGASNTVLGIFIVLFSTSIFMKINEQKNSVLRKSSNDARLRQANRISIGILVSSLIFLTFPSLFVGILGIFQLSILKIVGPFYAASLLANGICNAIIFIVNNGDARRVISKKSVSTSVNHNNI